MNDFNGERNEKILVVCGTRTHAHTHVATTSPPPTLPYSTLLYKGKSKHCLSLYKLTKIFVHTRTFYHSFYIIYFYFLSLSLLIFSFLFLSLIYFPFNLIVTSVLFRYVQLRSSLTCCSVHFRSTSLTFHSILLFRPFHSRCSVHSRSTLSCCSVHRQSLFCLARVQLS